MPLSTVLIFNFGIVPDRVVYCLFFYFLFYDLTTLSVHNIISPTVEKETTLIIKFVLIVKLKLFPFGRSSENRN